MAAYRWIAGIAERETEMKIALIGAGNMGSAFARLISSAGHSLAIASRDAKKGGELARATGATYNEQGDVAREADLVIVATGYGDALNALQAAGDLDGKVIVDVTNPLTPDYSGLTVGFDNSAAEELQRAFPASRVVKAFNTVFAQVLAAGPRLDGETVPVFVAGDDEEARDVVKQFVRSLGFVAIDAGGVKNSRYLEPLGGLNIYLGYGAGRGTAIAPSWIGIH